MPKLSSARPAKDSNEETKIRRLASSRHVLCLTSKSACQTQQETPTAISVTKTQPSRIPASYPERIQVGYNSVT